MARCRTGMYQNCSRSKSAERWVSNVPPHLPNRSLEKKSSYATLSGSGRVPLYDWACKVQSVHLTGDVCRLLLHRCRWKPATAPAYIDRKSMNCKKEESATREQNREMVTSSQALAWTLPAPLSHQGNWPLLLGSLLKIKQEGSGVLQNSQ